MNILLVLHLIVYLFFSPLAAYSGALPSDRIIDLYNNKESRRLQDWFESTVQNRARSKWQAPEQNYSSLTVFLIRLSPKGEIKDIESVYNSGSKSLEESARQALISASPTPVKPPVIFNDESVVLFSFEHKVNNKELSDTDLNFKQNSDYLNNCERYYLKLAEQNNPSVLYDLGEFHISGKAPFNKDYKKAFQYFSRSAELGFVPAKNAVAALYAIGLGCKQDPDKALLLFKEAAAAGFSSAQINLARTYVQGDKASSHSKEALTLYQKAARKGSSVAERELKILERLIKNQEI